MDLTFRPAGPSDRDWLFGLHERCMRPMVEREFREWDPKDQRARFDSRTEHDIRIVLLDGETIGAVHLDDAPDGSLFIGLLEIDPDHQNQGVGRAVLEHLIAEAAELSRKLTLRVRHANPAARLYRRVGFRGVDIDRTHYLLRLDPANRPD